MNNGKVRIYDLSKELNLDNKELLAICDQLDIAVKSHSSTISESEAEQIRTAAQKLIAANLAAKKLLKRNKVQMAIDQIHSQATRVPITNSKFWKFVNQKY